MTVKSWLYEQESQAVTDNSGQCLHKHGTVTVHYVYKLQAIYLLLYKWQI